ncbi:MAG TPA: class I SAM-dependent methyltransferase [Solirubrobacteraceae bacterium]|nr:class I SAM-dependent methyltransferase [Solirubrobacteraceae bacterium]
MSDVLGRDQLRLYGRRVREVGWSAGVSVLDGWDAVRGRRDRTLPPRRLRALAGDGDFRATGREMVELARDLGGLTPEAHVLDVGSGIGRIALALSTHLSPQGRYDGLEITPAAVRWCERHISPEHPGFRFHHADIYNTQYNPTGRIRAERYSFPFESGCFDFAILTSVFTHLVRPSLERYVSELGRTLARDGRVMATFFLLNDDSRARIERGESTQRLVHAVDDSGDLVLNPAVPEGAIGQPEEDVVGLLAANGLVPEGAIHYGTWCGRGEGVTYQDLLVARRA